MVALGMVAVLLFNKYRKQERKSSYILRIGGFTALFLISRICSFIHVYIYGFSPITYFTGDFIALSLQLGYTVFSYTGVFMLYLALERNIIKTKYIFSILTAILVTLAIVNHFMITQLSYNLVFYLQIPFFVPVILGIPSIYAYLSIKSAGEIRTNSIILCIGTVIFLIGLALAIPSAQINLWTKVIPSIIVELLAPTLHIAGISLMFLGFFRTAE